MIPEGAACPQHRLLLVLLFEQGDNPEGIQMVTCWLGRFGFLVDEVCAHAEGLGNRAELTLESENEVNWNRRIGVCVLTSGLCQLTALTSTGKRLEYTESAGLEWTSGREFVSEL